MDSTSDERTTNNTLRHKYRALSDVEKANVQIMKDLGDEIMTFLDALPPSREVSIGKTKLEECVMWVVKGITADPKPSQGDK